jgi:hypothetical protein
MPTLIVATMPPDLIMSCRSMLVGRQGGPGPETARPRVSPAARLTEINTAVNQMDQATQQNAAMVEQSTAAAATLASEAGHLRDLVNQFQLDDQHARAGTRAHTTHSEHWTPSVIPRRAG